MRFKKKISAVMATVMAVTACIITAPQAGMEVNANLVNINTWMTGYLENPSEIGITGLTANEDSNFVPGNYSILITYDTYHSTNTYYQTRGFTMQRCLATQEYTSSPERDPVNQEFITIKANQKNSDSGAASNESAEGDEQCYYDVWLVGANGEALPGTPKGGDKIYTVWYLSMDVIEEKIKEVSEDWYEYITTEPGFHYLKVDSLMTYYDDGTQMGDLLTRDVDSYYVNGKLYGVPDEINGLDGLLDYHSMPYFGPSTKLASHYGQHIDLQYIEGEEEPVEEEEDVESAESSYIDDFVRQYNTYSGNWASGASNGQYGQTPYFKAYNESRAYTDKNGKGHTNYDISASGGIPTKEKLVNGVEVDGFYGYVDIGKHTVTNTAWGPDGEEEFTVPWKYTRLVSNGHNALGQKSYTWKTYTGTWTGKVSREASYYYIWDMDIYDFGNATTENGAFPGGRTSYAGTGLHRMADGTMTSARPAYDAIISGKRCGDVGQATLSTWKPDNGEHITWKTCTMESSRITGKSKADCVKKAREWAEAQVGDDDYATVKNDYLSIGGFTVMDDTPVTAGDGADYLIEPKWMSDYCRETHETSGAFYGDDGEDGTHMLTIPANVANGLYYTAIDNTLTDEPDGVVYNQVFLANAGQSVSFSQDAGQDYISRRIKSGYTGNEPLLVHTPVIAPVALYDGDGDELTGEAQATQLVNENGKVSYQLRLDEDYVFKFEPARHLEIQGYKDSQTLDNAWEATDNKYDKYVKAKYVHFPFSVLVQDEYVEPVTDPDEDGYWIQVEDLETTEFYIPSWALEGVYGTGISNAEDTGIMYKVVSVNVVDSDGNDYDDGEHERDTANLKEATEGEAEYVATYEIPVQVSGWVYGFQIDGTNDRDTFEGYSDTWGDIWYAFCPTKQEKRAGSKNRLGGDAVRYSVDGSITTSWDIRDVLPLSNGSSHVYNKMGGAIQGTRFGYTLRTIANLYKEGDYISIKPTYRYYSPDGAMEEDIDIYYTDNSGDKEEAYVKGYSPDEGDVGLLRDLELKKGTKIDKSIFDGAYYDKDITYTADKRGISRNQLVNVERDCYTMSSLHVGSSLCLPTGDAEQLKINLDKNPADVTQPDDLGYISDSKWTEDAFRSSMQEWFGEYYIPSYLYVTKHHDDVDGEDYIHWYAGQQPGITTDDPIWYKGGFLVLNFEIVAHNSDKPQVKNLAYGTEPADSQWDTEGRRESFLIGDPNFGLETSIDTQPGDVAAVELGTKMTDRYSGKIFMIN